MGTKASRLSRWQFIWRNINNININTATLLASGKEVDREVNAARRK